MDSPAELTIYQKITNPVEAATEMGKQIMHSEMFGCKSASSGTMLAWECFATGMSLLTLAKRYHIIHGRLSMRAETMLALFRSDAGGHHKILSRTPEEAAIELTCDGEVNVFRLTWQEALAEPFVYEGKEGDIVAKLLNGKTQGLRIKAKYATPRSRMQMLWARLISDSIRIVAPEIITGVYVPEEVDDFAAPVRAQKPDPVVTVDVKAFKPTAPTPVSAPVPQAPVGPVVSMGTAGPLVAEEDLAEEDLMCEATTTKLIIDYAEAVKMPADKMAAILQKYNAESVAGLPGKVATELLSILKKQFNELGIPF